MPKNWGENSKSVQAKARKDAVRKEEAEKKKKEAEDKLWEDNDKHVLKKQQRKEELEKKNLEKTQKKEEAKKLLEEEMKGLKSAKPEKTEKVTKYEIDKIKEHHENLMAQAAQKAELEKKKITEEPIDLVENVNRIQIEGDVARNVEQAISILTDSPSEIDLHPEKRMRAAYLEFEENNLERLKKENPNMRLSQIKQILKKEWQKSPLNPMNKVFL